ncbi:MAG: hypothetical protein RR478_02700 [Bacilli bacterium]
MNNIIEKENKFKKLAENRVNNTIKNIQLIGNLANTSNYEYTDESVKKIFKTIREELIIVESKFKDRNRNKGFKL